MTPVDIDNLEPGPETDALVARSLGWAIHPDYSAHSVAPGAALGYPPDEERTEEFTGLRPVPPYSTDWNAVTEALHASGLPFHCLIDCYPDKKPQYHMQLDRYPASVFSHASTGPMAICKVILKAEQSQKN